ncbi:MAG: ABC transporter substrate-binding protein [Coriobacteriia bacterium]|nr:ABC transporter substrate-binding protein [Coriobacteriia bacterium]
MSKKVLALLCAMLLVVSTIGLAACGKSNNTGNTNTSTTTTDTAGTASLKTLTPGKLTIATGQPAYSPWVEDNKPESGKGFEAALGYAIADKMGFAKADVVWVRTGFDAAITPGPKTFDFNLQQYSATAEREQAVDFSTPYYTTSQVILSNANNKYANAKSLADLKGAKVGAASASTSLTLAQKLFGANAAPFNSNDDVVQALKVNQIDCAVVDMPTAWYMTSAQLDNGKIIGELPSEGTTGDQLAALLPKDSPLTSAVSKAIDELKADGTLAQLEEQWLRSGGDIPILK